MKKNINILSVAIILFLSTAILSAQSVKIGPRITGNMNIYNQDGLAGSWSGIGVGIGGTVDISFSKTIGMITNLTVFDMKNFSNSITNNNVTEETSLSLAYLTIDPLFKAEFSGFYMVGGVSVGIKISSSGEKTKTSPGINPVVTSFNLETNSIKFDIAAGTGYNFKLSQSLVLGSDFMVYIPLSNTFDSPGTSNSTLSLKLGASLKFRI